MNNKTVVTRHKDLVKLLIEKGIVDETTPVLEHTDNIEDVRDKDIIGVIPAKLAIFANSVTECKLTIPKERSGIELPLEELRGYAGGIYTYKVEKIPTRTDFSDVILATASTTAIQYMVRKGYVERKGKIHMDAVNRVGRLTREDIEGKSVLGHIPFWLGQYAKDISTVALYYEFDRRGLVHTFEEMETHNPEMITYKIKRLI